MLIFASNIICIIYLGFNIAHADDPITAQDAAALKTFLPLVKRHLPHKYMESDDYLIRWIRVKKYDLLAAKDMLIRNLEWRKRNDIDNLKQNEGSIIQQTFPVKVVGNDKEGRTVYITYWGDDPAKFLKAGKFKEFVNQLGTGFEMAEKHIVHKINTNSSEFIGIYDFEGFSRRSHLCIKCLSLYLEHAYRSETYYPLRAKNYYVLNAPPTFDLVLLLVTPIMRTSMEKIIVYGPNPPEWKSALLKIIHANQLPSKYGGTKQS